MLFTCAAQQGRQQCCPCLSSPQVAVQRQQVHFTAIAAAVKAPSGRDWQPPCMPAWLQPPTAPPQPLSSAIPEAWILDQPCTQR